MLDERFDPTIHRGPYGPSNGGPAGKFSVGADAPTAAPRLSGPSDPEPPLPAVARPRLELSLTQILGSTAAAVTAAFLGSRLGVAGTLIGAALASFISVVGGAVYTTSIKATRHRVAQALVAVRGQDDDGRPECAPTALMPVVPIPAPPVLPRAGRGPGRRTAPSRPARPLLRGVLVGAALSAVVFVAALTLVTGYESVSGTALAGQAGGLTVLGGAADGPRTGTPKVTPTSTRAVGPNGARTSGSGTPTAAATERATGPVVGTSKPATGSGTSGPTGPPTTGGRTTAAPHDRPPDGRAHYDRGAVHLAGPADAVAADDARDVRCGGLPRRDRPGPDGASADRDAPFGASPRVVMSPRPGRAAASSGRLARP